MGVLQIDIDTGACTRWRESKSWFVLECMTLHGYMFRKQSISIIDFARLCNFIFNNQALLPNRFCSILTITQQLLASLSWKHRVLFRVGVHGKLINLFDWCTGPLVAVLCSELVPPGFVFLDWFFIAQEFSVQGKHNCILYMFIRYTWLQLKSSDTYVYEDFTGESGPF